MSREFAVRTDPRDQTRTMMRDNAALEPEQGKREPVVNSIEHRVLGRTSVYVADVEKVGARTLRDEYGNPVFRRVHVDSSSGMHHNDMVSLLVNHGMSSKPTEVFAGNHGQGLILANGMDNPAGLYIISKAAGQDAPYLSVWDVQDDQGGLRSFEIIEEDEDGEDYLAESVACIEVTPALVVDGLNILEVWESAFDNPKFNRQVPESATVIVECGKTLTDSTYYSTQQIFDPAKNEWVYSRWAFGQYLNARFWEFPEDMELYWGVPGGNFQFDFQSYGFKPGETAVTFGGSQQWGYRRIDGLREIIHKMSSTNEGDADDTLATIEQDSKTYPDCVVPFKAEVYIRTLPEGVQARKLNFQARRKGVIFLDFHDEIYPKLQGDPYGQFGMSHAAARESVWVRLIPLKFGGQSQGSVWVGSGRKDVFAVDRFGNNIDLPWHEMAAAFRKNMPPKLVEWIRARDAQDTSVSFNDRRINSWWEKIEARFKKTKTRTVTETITETVPVVTGTGTEPGERNGKRGPIVNPGETHPPGDGETTRKPPQKGGGKQVGEKKQTITRKRKQTDKVADKRPKHPMCRWVENAEDWPEDLKTWGVIYDEPSDANDQRGMLKLNWHHWWVQQWYAELCEQTQTPTQVQRRLREVLERSALTKLGHRLAECRNRELAVSRKDRETIFSPPALTGYLLGLWDHERRVLDGLVEIAEADVEEAAA
jgi:hypothetical protein